MIEIKSLPEIFQYLDYYLIVNEQILECIIEHLGL